MNAIRVRRCFRALVVCCFAVAGWGQDGSSRIGREVAISQHLQNGQEYQLAIPQLTAFGKKLFTAKWTIQEGQGRPKVKGTATSPPLSDPADPLVFPRNFNRISGPDSNSCSGCHNEPFIGGGGDRATEVFVLGQRFDFATFDRNDLTFTRGAVDERGEPVTLQTVANERKTIGMNGSGFIEMLARQMTADLQLIRNATVPGTSQALVVWVAAYTDLKLHDITTGSGDPNAEPLDQNQPVGTPNFFAGNTKFITRKLWGVGNSGPYMHHGKFTTMREAILAHSGEALRSRQNFESISAYDRDCIIEFLKTLQILPERSR